MPGPGETVATADGCIWKHSKPMCWVWETGRVGVGHGCVHVCVHGEHPGVSEHAHAGGVCTTLLLQGLSGSTAALLRSQADSGGSPGDPRAWSLREANPRDREGRTGVGPGWTPKSSQTGQEEGSGVWRDRPPHPLCDLHRGL